MGVCEGLELHGGRPLRQWGEHQEGGLANTVFFSKFFYLVVLGTEPEGLCLLGKCSGTELPLQPTTMGLSFSVSSLRGCAFP